MESLSMWKIHVSKGSLGHIQLHLPSVEQYTTRPKPDGRRFVRRVHIRWSATQHYQANGWGERNCFLTEETDCGICQPRMPSSKLASASVLAKSWMLA